MNYEFEKSEVAQHILEKEMAMKFTEDERGRVAARDARGRLNELTQSQRINICYSYGVLHLPF